VGGFIAPGESAVSPGAISTPVAGWLALAVGCSGSVAPVVPQLDNQLTMVRMTAGTKRRREELIDRFLAWSLNAIGRLRRHLFSIIALKTHLAVPVPGLVVYALEA
jgi:hypothetical protein